MPRQLNVHLSATAFRKYLVSQYTHSEGHPVSLSSQSLISEATHEFTFLGGHQSEHIPVSSRGAAAYLSHPLSLISSWIPKWLNEIMSPAKPRKDEERNSPQVNLGAMVKRECSQLDLNYYTNGQESTRLITPNKTQISST